MTEEDTTTAPAPGGENTDPAVQADGSAAAPAGESEHPVGAPAATPASDRGDEESPRGRHPAGKGRRQQSSAVAGAAVSVSSVAARAVELARGDVFVRRSGGVRAVEARLLELGVEGVGVDGRLDTATVEALTGFAERSGTGDGPLGRSTLEALFAGTGAEIVD